MGKIGVNLVVSNYRVEGVSNSAAGKIILTTLGHRMVRGSIFRAMYHTYCEKPVVCFLETELRIHSI